MTRETATAKNSIRLDFFVFSGWIRQQPQSTGHFLPRQSVDAEVKVGP